MNGLTYFAPAFAARIAWFALKTKVQLIRTPSADRALIAFSPSVVIWTFTTTFLWSFASWRPCFTISGASVLVTSRLIGPSTSARMSWITSPHFRPVLATMVGFVVTPSRTPHEAASRISLMSAVSRKIFTMDTACAGSRRMRAVKNVSCRPPGATAGDLPAMEARRRLHPEERPRGEAAAEGDEDDADRAGDRCGPGACLLRENHEGQPA